MSEPPAQPAKPESPPVDSSLAGQNLPLIPWQEGIGSTLIVAVFLGLFLWIFDALLLRPHFTEILSDRTKTANHLNMLSAVVAAAGGLLQAGIIVLAPILSLALHQSYDALFSFILRIDSDPVRSDAERDLSRDCITTLMGYHNTYRVLNPLYYGIWVLTCLHLLIATLKMSLRPWLGADVMHEAMAFFITSCVLCLLFASVSVIFFFSIRPGTTKLDYYIRYFTMRANMPPLRKETRRTKQTLVSLSFAILIIALVAFAVTYEQKRERLSVAINSLAVASAPVFVAADPNIGLLRTTEMEYSEIPFPAGRLALDALMGGDVDVATVAETPVVLATVGRPDLRVLATIAESQFRVVARRSAGVSVVSDLKGKRVAFLVGSSSEYFLGRLLGKSRLTMADVIGTNLQPPDMVNALRRGDVDAISIWEPHAQRAMEAVGTDSVVFDSKDLYREYFNIVSTLAVLRDEGKRRAIREFLSTLADAAKKMQGDPARAWRVIGDRLSMDVRELEAIWPRFTFEVTPPTETLVKAMEGVEAWDATAKSRQTRRPDELRQVLDDSLSR